MKSRTFPEREPGEPSSRRNATLELGPEAASHLGCARAPGISGFSAHRLGRLDEHLFVDQPVQPRRRTGIQEPCRPGPCALALPEPSRSPVGGGPNWVARQHALLPVAVAFRYQIQLLNGRAWVSCRLHSANLCNDNMKSFSLSFFLLRFLNGPFFYN